LAPDFHNLTLLLGAEATWNQILIDPILDCGVPMTTEFADTLALVGS